MAQEVPLGYDGDPWRARRPRAETRVAGHALGRGRAGHGPCGESRREKKQACSVAMETGERTGPAVARGSCTRRPGGREWRCPVGFQGEIRPLSFVAEGPYQASVYLAVPRRWNLTWGIPKNVQGGNPTLSHQDGGDTLRLHPSRRSVASPPVYPREALFPQLFLCHLQPAPRQVLRLRQMLGWSSEALRGIWLLSLGSPGMGA